MFDLVADIEHYPEFVPLCRGLKVRSRTPQAEGVEVVVADMTVSHCFMHEIFTSRVTLDRPSLQIHVEYLKGPFSKLKNRWNFRATVDAAFRRFAAAFERRADQIYARKIA